MDSRQRVALSLDHKEPDRVPVDYWATPAVTARLLAHFGFSTEDELLQHFDIDFSYIDRPEYVSGTGYGIPQCAIPTLWRGSRGKRRGGLGLS